MKKLVYNKTNACMACLECVRACSEAFYKEFNPDFHNAVMQVASEEFESGFVAQELQKGYTYRDAVVRHSMVAVVQQ